MSYVILAKSHNNETWDPMEQKMAPTKLFLLDQSTPAAIISPETVWLESITRKDSGTLFTTALDRALRFETEGEADEKVTELVLQYGYLPDDLAAEKLEEGKEPS